MLFSVTANSVICVPSDTVTLGAQLMLSNAILSLWPKGQHRFHIFLSSHPLYQSGISDCVH